MAKLKVGDTYEGPLAIFDDESVDGVHGYYALDEDGKELLEQAGKPVRLMQVDLAPGDDEDGSERYVVADKNDPSQQIPSEGNGVVELEPDNVKGKTDTGLGG